MRKNFSDDISHISKWISACVKDAGADGIVIGLSGGIDSAVVAALCKKALGASKILAVAMPCYSIPGDARDALRIAKHLKIECPSVNLDSPFTTLLSSLSITFHDRLKQIPISNVKSRLRMTALYAIANQRNYLVVGTSNKSEMSIGYFTKYGDGGCDIEPIAEYYKTEVKKLAKALKLPSWILKRVPSAGLWKGQTDEGQIGLSYSTLDQILAAEDLEKAYKYKRIFAMIEKSEHKRHMPPSCPRNDPPFFSYFKG